jgi:hypothetical protein
MNMQPVLERRLQDLNLTMELPATLELCNAALRTYQTELKTLIDKQLELRHDENESRSETHAMQGSATKQANVQALNHKEQMSQIFSQIRSIRSTQSKRGQFTSLQIPISWPSPDEAITNIQELPDPKAIQHDESLWRTVKLPSEVTYYLRLRNGLHFGQAQGTPFTEPPLS